MDEFKNWYALSINMNKEKSTKAELLARRAAFHDTNIEDVDYLVRKELVIEKSGKRRIVNKLLMSGYLLVKVKPQIIENEDGTKEKVFPGDTFKLITETNGIKFFVNCDQDNPLPFRAREIKRLFEMCDDAHLEVKMNLDTQFDEGEILEVVAGPFAGYRTEVVSVSGDKILGQIDMFGRVIPAEFTKNQVMKTND